MTHEYSHWCHPCTCVVHDDEPFVEQARELLSKGSSDAEPKSGIAGSCAMADRDNIVLLDLPQTAAGASKSPGAMDATHA